MKSYAFANIALLVMFIGCHSVDADTASTSLDDAKYLELELGVDEESDLIGMFGEGEFYMDTVYKTYCYTDATNRIALFKFYDIEITGGDPDDPGINQVRMVELVSDVGKKSKPLCKTVKTNLPGFGELKLGMTLDETIRIFVLNGFVYQGSEDGKKLVNYFNKENKIGLKDAPESYKQYAQNGLIEDITYTVKMSDGKVVSIAKQLSYRQNFD